MRAGGGEWCSLLSLAAVSWLTVGCGPTALRNPFDQPAAGSPPRSVGGTGPIGSLPRESIRQTVRQNIGAVRACYEAQLAHEGQLRGRVTVTFVIDPDGIVRTSRVSESSMEPRGPAADAAEACVEAAVRRCRFEAPHGGGPVLVSYPFVLDTHDDAPREAAWALAQSFLNTGIDCRRSFFEADPTLRGAFELRIDVGSDGFVMDAAVSGDALSGHASTTSAVRECVLDGVRGWRMDAPGGDPFSVYPTFTFHLDPSVAPRIEVAGWNPDDPGLTRQSLREEIQSRYVALLPCYGRSLDVEARLVGRLEVTFVITVDGTAAQAHVTRHDLMPAGPAADELAHCVEAAVSAWSFPRPRFGPVLVQYPFSFHPTVPVAGGS